MAVLPMNANEFGIAFFGFPGEPSRRRKGLPYGRAFRRLQWDLTLAQDLSNNHNYAHRLLLNDIDGVSRKNWKIKLGFRVTEEIFCRHCQDRRTWRCRFSNHLNRVVSVLGN